MGRCQACYCGHSGAEIVPAAASIPVEAGGRLRSQVPVKPLPMDTHEVEAVG
jgi:hypothetical protein